MASPVSSGLRSYSSPLNSVPSHSTSTKNSNGLVWPGPDGNAPSWPEGNVVGSVSSPNNQPWTPSPPDTAAGLPGTTSARSIVKTNVRPILLTSTLTMSRYPGTLAADPGPVFLFQAASPAGSVTTLVSGAAASNAAAGWPRNAVGAFRSVQPARKASSPPAIMSCHGRFRFITPPRSPLPSARRGHWGLAVPGNATRLARFHPRLQDTLRLPRGLSAAVAEAGDARAVGAHHIDLVLVGLVLARERDLAAVRRPGWRVVVRRVVREVLHARPVGIHDVDVTAQRRADAATEGDLRAVRRPGRPSVIRRIVCEVRDGRAVGVHHVDLTVAVAIALEGDLRAVGRPGRPPGGHRVVGEPGDSRAVGIHHIDVVDPVGPVAVAREGDPSAVRRPSRVDVRRGGVREPAHARAVSIHHIDLLVAVASAHKGDRAEWWRGRRPGGVGPAACQRDQ